MIFLQRSIRDPRGRKPAVGTLAVPSPPDEVPSGPATDPLTYDCRGVPVLPAPALWRALGPLPGLVKVDVLPFAAAVKMLGVVGRVSPVAAFKNPRRGRAPATARGHHGARGSFRGSAVVGRRSPVAAFKNTRRGRAPSFDHSIAQDEIDVNWAHELSSWEKLIRDNE